MYSETIQKLIDSVIADGEISEKERNVLHKKAEAEGQKAYLRNLKIKNTAISFIQN